MKVLILGGSGFVGAHLIPALLDGGATVTLLNRGNKYIQNTTQRTADRNMPEELHKALTDASKFDTIIDTSAYTQEQTQIAWELASPLTNHWIHLSSAAVYTTSTQSNPPQETDPIGGAPIWGTYGTEKSGCERFLQTTDTETAITTIRPPYLYGSQNAYDRERFIWKRLHQNRPILIPENGRCEIQMLHAADLASAITLLAANPTTSYNAYNVGAEILSIKEWVKQTSACAAAPLNYVHVKKEQFPHYTARDFFPFRNHPCQVATKKIEETHGWKPTISLAEGLKETYADIPLKSYETATLETEKEDKILQTLNY